MPTYLFKCTGCQREVELKQAQHDTPPRHLAGDEVCGTLKRVWAVNFARVPGGGRECAR